jgi:phage terminase small subunit
MDRGRKAIPFKLLQLKGTAREHRHGDGKNEIKPGDPKVAPAKRYAFPKPPRVDGKPVLGPVGLKEWRNVRRLMEATGVITQIDHATLYAYCTLYQQSVTKPASMTGSLWTQLRMFASELGFTPSSRERLRRPIAD